MGPKLSPRVYLVVSPVRIDNRAFIFWRVTIDLLLSKSIRYYLRSVFRTPNIKPCNSTKKTPTSR